jgi:hypothetical protein
MTDRTSSVLLRGRQRAPALLGAVLTLGLAACEFPTEIPKWDTLWVVPADSASIGVGEILPSTITTAPGGSAFELSLQPVTVTRTLGELCGPGCSLASGLTVPKPAFTATLAASVPLPGDIVSAQLTGGTIQVALSHDFPFDPIRPSSTERGYIVLTATVGSTVIARDSIAGEATAFDPGTTLTRTLTLAAATVDGPVTVSATLSSPAGDPVTIDTSDGLTFTVTPSQIRVSQAQVRVANLTIDAAEVELDVGDVDAAVTDNVRAGALLLALDNPFAVSGDLGITITTGPGATINKSVPLAQGKSNVRVEFNEQEIRSILEGSPVMLRANGVVCATTCTTAVTPTQTLTIASRLELTIGPKED